jgi:uncharacterized membrane protein
MSPELATLFTSMIPFVDMKFGIPFGISLGLSATTATLFGVAGSLIPAIIMLKILGPVSDFLRKHSKKLDNFFTKLFAKTRAEHSKNFERYEALFIILFIVIPLPGSGPGAAALIAFVFGVEYWKAIGLLALGAIGSGLLVTTGVTSVIHLFKFLQ